MPRSPPPNSTTCGSIRRVSRGSFTVVSKSDRLAVRRFAHVAEVDIDFGDLTVIVGPQASGKSLVLQLFKLAMDGRAIAHTLRRNDLLFRGGAEFLDRYFGEGTGGMWTSDTEVALNGEGLSPEATARSRQTQAWPEHAVYYVPAHRTLAVTSGYPPAFREFTKETPFVVRQFSAAIRDILLSHGTEDLFPTARRLKRHIRRTIDEAIFHGAALREDASGSQRQLVLDVGEQRLTYMTWTAGQREFVPLLLGTYYLLTSGQKTKRSETYVIIEEPEMGLHPRGISAVMLLVLDLLLRGYKVILSTHAPLVLDFVWALQRLQRLKAPWRSVLQLFGIDGVTAGTAPGEALVAQAALAKEYRAYMLDFGPDQRVRSHDITSLDPSSSDRATAGWGDLTGLSTRIADVVAAAVNTRRAAG